MEGTTVACLGRDVTFGAHGLPTSIRVGAAVWAGSAAAYAAFYAAPCGAWYGNSGKAS